MLILKAGKTTLLGNLVALSFRLEISIYSSKSAHINNRHPRTHTHKEAHTSLYWNKVEEIFNITFGSIKTCEK